MTTSAAACTNLPPGRQLPATVVPASGAVDCLLECLFQVARLNLRPVSRTALLANLPVTKRGLTPALFSRAADRVDLASQFCRGELGTIQSALLPAILLLDDEQACVLLGTSDSGHARVLLPEALDAEVTMPLEELAARYVGVYITVKPRFRLDQRMSVGVPAVHEHWFWDVLRQQLPLYRDMLGAALLINLFAVALPMFTMNVYDRVVPNFAESTLWMLAVGMGMVIVADYVLRVLRAYFVDLAGTRIDLTLSTRLVERVLGMRMEDKPASVGAYANTLRSFESVRDFVASATVTALIDVPFALLFIVVCGWISWPLLVVPVVGIAAVIAYGAVAQKTMHRLAETTYKASAQRNGALVESLSALETIKALGAEATAQHKLESTAAFLASTTAQLRLASAKVVNSVSTIQQAVTVATVVGGVYLIHAGELTTGGLVAVSMLAGRALAPLGQTVALLMQYQTARTSLQALDETFKREVERPAGKTWLQRGAVQGEIAFRNVAFRYPGAEQLVVNDLSLTIRAGEKVVIIGRIGSGKSTLQRLVLGLYPCTEGVLTIDGIDVRQLDPADLRRQIGYVEQEPTLFYGTLRENIAVAAPAATDAEVLAAAEFAGLLPFVNRHPQGFDMLIGERGQTLSGGQRQRIALARAMLRDPPILLLDEPTGAMDFTSEAEFKDKLRTAAAGKTVVIVTHRSSLIDLADRLVVMDDGVVVADGPRDSVLRDLGNGRVRKAA